MWRETSAWRHFRHWQSRLSCVHRREVVHEQALDEIVEGREACLSPAFRAEELVAEPERYPRVGVQPSAAGAQGLARRASTQSALCGVVRAVPAIAARRSTRGRMANRPLVRLLCSHREADREREPLDAERLGEQPVLGASRRRRS